jgi:hypothetical protein
MGRSHHVIGFDGIAGSGLEKLSRTALKTNPMLSRTVGMPARRLSWLRLWHLGTISDNIAGDQQFSRPLHAAATI